MLFTFQSREIYPNSSIPLQYLQNLVLKLLQNGNSRLTRTCMSQARCILCLREIEKDYERFIVESKKSTAVDVHGELGNLEFLVHETSKLSVGMVF